MELSITALRNFQTCESRLWWQKVIGVSAPFDASPAMQLGTLIHKRLECLLPHLSKMDKEELIALNSTLTDGEMLGGEIIGFTAKQLRQAKHLVASYIPYIDAAFARPAVLPSGQLAVELPLRADVAGYTMTGFIDAILVDKRTDELIVVDWKTRRKPSDSRAYMLDIQMPFYVWAARQQFGLDVVAGSIIELLTPENAREPLAIEHRFGDEQIEYAMGVIESLLARIKVAERDGFLPASHMYVCSACPYLKRCADMYFGRPPDESQD